MSKSTNPNGRATDVSPDVSPASSSTCTSPLGAPCKGEGSVMFTSADYFFDSYRGSSVFECILKDEKLNSAYSYAIRRNEHLFTDKIVLDVGCGFGQLSMLALDAGAAAVVAVEQSPEVVQVAADIAKKNGSQPRFWGRGCENRDTVPENREVEGQASTTSGCPKPNLNQHDGCKLHFVTGSLRQPGTQQAVQNALKALGSAQAHVDIILSIPFGYCLFFESRLQDVCLARDLFLNKKTGLLIPDHVELQVRAVVSADEWSTPTSWRRGAADGNGKDDHRHQEAAECHGDEAIEYDEDHGAEDDGWELEWDNQPRRRRHWWRRQAKSDIDEDHYNARSAGKSLSSKRRRKSCGNVDAQMSATLREDTASIAYEGNACGRASSTSDSYNHSDFHYDTRANAPDLSSFYGFDFSPLQRVALREPLHSNALSSEAAVWSDPATTVTSLNFYTMDRDSARGNFATEIFLRRGRQEQDEGTEDDDCEEDPYWVDALAFTFRLEFFQSSTDLAFQCDTYDTSAVPSCYRQTYFSLLKPLPAYRDSAFRVLLHAVNRPDKRDLHFKLGILEDLSSCNLTSSIAQAGQTHAVAKKTKRNSSGSHYDSSSSEKEDQEEGLSQQRKDAKQLSFRAHQQQLPRLQYFDLTS
ncbi:unnamed protein product [Amoebophrya sp. A25]|nr:unnamed protein product [Amoebophrya sp. A25]|eukprot:GSA25T00013319001.1